MKKIILLIILITFGCTSSNTTISKLTCEELQQAQHWTKQTSIYLDGSKNLQEYKKIYEACQSENPTNLSKCEEPSCNLAFAMKAKDISECGNDTICINAFAAINIDNCNYYDTLDYPSDISVAPRNTCLISKANITLNRKYCDQIETISMFSCNSNYCTQLNQFEEGLCERVLGKVVADNSRQNYTKCTFSRNKCLQILADKQNDISICDSMSKYTLEKSICYLAYAMKNNAPSYCSKIEETIAFMSEEDCITLTEQLEEHPTIKSGNGILESANYFKK